MKQFCKVIIIILIIGIIYLFKEPIAKYLTKHIKITDNSSDVLITNQYYSNNNYRYVFITDNFYPNSKQDLINIFYTVLNAGMEEFTFYCKDTYSSCMNDIDEISKDRILLSNINNFVNSYNSFQDIETKRYEYTGKISLKITYIYTDEEIDAINKKIKQVINEKITNDMTVEDKIKTIHDYIIDNSKYDSLKSDEKINNYKSHIAYGPLFEGYGLCNGYADAMKLFLNELDIDSIKISSENHIWNLVYINNEWLHLDLTWDDPVLDNGKDIIDYEYFLISTDELYEKKDNQHYFDENIYQEAL